ncbi:MAG: alanine racemase [Flavobacteriaceae bacterium]|jgi:alanine racemase
MNKDTSSVLEINLSALAHNYRYIRSKLNPNTKLLGVVKANGYGSESIAIAKKLESLGIDYLAVAYIQEGIILREEGVKVPILVLHPQVEQFNALISNCLEPSLYSIRTLEAFIRAAKGNENYPIHLKINTGLNRLGLSAQDFKAVFKLLDSEKSLHVKGLLSHLAASDDPLERAFTQRQINLFKDCIQIFESTLGPIEIKHLLNTSGILHYPEAQFQMARSGIGLYGYSNAAKTDAELRPVATLKCKISQIHELAPGDWVGYNKGFVAKEKMKIATLTIGHADGIGRQYGHGKGVVTIHGAAAPIIGNVCMDMIMVNLGSIEAKEGDVVVVFGGESSESLTAELFAKGAKTISYELLTGIGARVKRHIIV